jgi:hypothetical protein
MRADGAYGDVLRTDGAYLSACEASWRADCFDDAHDEMTANLGLHLLQPGGIWACSGDVFAATQLRVTSDMPAAVWNVCEPETVALGQRLFAAAGARVSVCATAGSDAWSIQQAGCDISQKQLAARAIRACESAGPVAILARFDASGVPDDQLTKVAAELFEECAWAGAHGFLATSLCCARQAQLALLAAKAANEHLAIRRPIILSFRELPEADEVTTLLGDGAASVGLDHMDAQWLMAHPDAVSQVLGARGRFGYLELVGLPTACQKLAREREVEDEFDQLVQTIRQLPVALVATGANILPAQLAALAELWS